MKRLLANIELLSNRCFLAGAAVAGFALFMMTLLVTVDVIGRKLGHATGVAHEISGYSLVLIVFLGMAYALRKGAHIKIELITMRLTQLTRRWLKVATSFGGMAFSVWLILYTTKHAIEYYTHGSRSMTFLHVPLWPLQMLVPIGLGLFTLAILLETIKTIIGHNAE